MNKLLSVLLITCFIFTNHILAAKLNPVIYSALGDKIYNNIDNISALKEIKEYRVYKDEIITYTKEVKDAKTMGFAIEDGDKSIKKSTYLKILRKLSKSNDYFVQNVKSNFKYSIKNQDNKLFVNSVDSGLLDVKRYAKDIKKYYKNHENEIESYGDILGKLILTYEPKVKKVKKYNKPTKQEIQDAKMRRIRKKDKEKQESIQKELEDNLVQQKRDIREVQKKELESTSR